MKARPLEVLSFDQAGRREQLPDPVAALLHAAEAAFEQAARANLVDPDQRRSPRLRTVAWAASSQSPDRSARFRRSSRRSCALRAGVSGAAPPRASSRSGGTTPRTASTGSPRVARPCTPTTAAPALNLNLHFHMLFLDGVYLERPDGSLSFRWVKAPTSAARR
jgi:hypothetical protein